MLLSFSFIGVFIFVLLPFAGVIRKSFLMGVQERFVALENYHYVFANPAFRLASKNSTLFFLNCIPLLLLLSFFLALGIQAVFTYEQKFIKTAYLLPMAISVSSIVLVWKVLFSYNGLINSVFYPNSPIDFMNSQHSFTILLGSYIWKNIGYNIILWVAGLSNISKLYYEAARVDGASRWQCLIHITIPNLATTIYIQLIISTVNSFKVFREAYLVAGEYPHNSMYLMQHLFNNWFANLNLEYLCAAAVLMAGMIVISVVIISVLLELIYEK